MVHPRKKHPPKTTGSMGSRPGIPTFHDMAGLYHMGASNRATPSYHPLDSWIFMDFPWNQPSSDQGWSRGTPMTMETPWNPRRCDTRDTNSTINPHHHRSSLLCFNDSAPVQMPISIFETTAWAAKWWPSSNVKKFWWGPKLTPGTNGKCWLRRCSLRNCPEIGHSCGLHRRFRITNDVLWKNHGPRGQFATVSSFDFENPGANLFF